MANAQLDFKWCQLCIGGQVFNHHRQCFTTCTLCSGRGYLPRNVECACSRPVVIISADGLPYCGDKECVKDLRADKAHQG